MSPVLLDTNILSAILRGHPAAVARAKTYRAAHRRFTFSAFTRFEAIRGFKAKNASVQLLAFEAFCAANEVLPLTDAIFDRAADIYADLHGRGELIGDADTLIAATALENGLDVATNNVSHFSRVTGLKVHDWLAP